MALVEVTDEINKVEIVGEFKHIQIRSATWVEKDGVMIGSQQYSRRVISPLDDVSSESTEVQAIAAAVHTQAVKDAYQAHLDAQASEMAGE
jgi:hypothetical protein